MDQKLIRIRSRLEEVNEICQAVSDAAENAGFDDRTSYAIELAVCEACENIVVHGYGEDEDGAIEVRISGETGDFIVDITDDAPEFNPASVEPSPPTPANDPPAGGFGLHILQQVMDEVSYTRKGDQNRLRLVKRGKHAPT
jgi:anti-sigma regulatory factor (Ser/Thr protein kinase)